MALTDEQRKQGARRWTQKVFVEQGETAMLDTNNIKAAFDAADTWVEANQASFNQSLPEPFKSTATLQQKSVLMAYVVMKRVEAI